MKIQHALFIVCILLGGLSNSQAQLSVLCIGDSITEGVYVSTPYPTRLARNTGYRVINAGIGGERAARGLERIDALLQEHKPSHVLILFGTNDILSPSQDLRASANAVLGMAQRALARGVIPVVGTAPPMVNPRAWNMPRVRTFNNYVRSLAATHRLRLADIQSAFGTGGGLIISDGFHPNDNGMEVIARTFAGRVSPNDIPLPTAPTLVTPTGLIPFALRPTFTWQPGAHASSHVLYLYQNGTLYHRTETTATTWTATFDLPCAAYTWTVRGKNGRGEGPEASRAALYFQEAACCIPITPTGLHQELIGAGQVAYLLDADACATEYQLWIQRNGQTWSTNWHVAAAGNPARIVVEGHTAGAYRWWVRGQSADGISAWTAGPTFNFGTPIPVEPAGRQLSAPETWVWNDLTSDLAERYHIWLKGGESFVWSGWISHPNTYATGANLRATTLTGLPSLPYGVYTWWMQSQDASGSSAWSGPRTFTLGQPIPIAPTGTISSFATLVWDDQATQDATWYQLWVSRNGTHFHSEWIKWENTMEEEGLKRSYPVPATSAYGQYSFWVRAYKPQGIGPWSSALSFNRGYAQPVEPYGPTAYGVRRFSWDDTQSSDGTWFRIWINRNGVTFWNGWFNRVTDAVQESDALWSVQLPSHVTLPPGEYTWWIMPWNPSGMAVWSDGNSFSVLP